MARRIALLAIAVLLVAIIVAWINREPLMMYYFVSQIAPDHDFDPARLPAAPDYRDPDAWAALPETTDLADVRPPGADTRHTPAAPVFFLHPTTFISPAGWNQPLGDETTDWITRQRILRHQAATFNGCCDIHAPHYRQATFYSFMEPFIDESKDNGKQALDLAFADIRNAFADFLQRIGDADFLIAGHSQGTLHATRLLREDIMGTPLQSRLIAAYLVGYSLTTEDLEDMGLPVCATPRSTGCAVGWNAVETDNGNEQNDAQNVCVNPLTFDLARPAATAEANLGGIGFPRYERAAKGEDLDAMTVEPAAADATCSNGQLQIADLRSDAFPVRLWSSSLHVYDYSLYHLNIRQNAIERVRAWQQQRSNNP